MAETSESIDVSMAEIGAEQRGSMSRNLAIYAQSQASVAQVHYDDDFGEGNAHLSEFDEMETFVDVDALEAVEVELGAAEEVQVAAEFDSTVDVDAADELAGIDAENVNGEYVNSLGKVFATVEDAYKWYNRYALTKGFGTRLAFNRRSRKNNEIIQKRFVCNKQGLKKPREVDNGKEVKRYRDTRTGCEAMMEVKLSASKNWVISKFQDIHNHELSTPSKVVKHRSHTDSHRSIACKSLVGDLSNSGIRPCIISRAVAALTESQDMTVTPRQCSQLIQKERRTNIGRECLGVIKHFQERAASDDAYFFAIDLDDDGFLKNVFWADGRSRASYTQFGDVIVFDVTYKTNKFKMPFAPFVGVNHHRQSILFGGALLMDETEVTFTWVFEQFLTCMQNIEPPAIITYEDKAMGNAIRKVFPNSRHRFCAWHVGKHAIEHLASLRSQNVTFNPKYKELMSSDTVAQFEAKWELFSKEFNVEHNSWLGKMYGMRRHWVKAYLNDVFFVGMTSSGRSESIHAFFDGYLNSNTMLQEFVVQYDSVVQARRDAENDEDFRTLNSKAVLCYGHPIEEQVGKFYTRSVFNMFQTEWKKSVQLFHEKIDKEFNVVRYKVGIPLVEQARWRTVMYEQLADTFNIKCPCAKFETGGILCKHILYILRKKQVKQIPKKYMLDRWSIDSRFRIRGIGGTSTGNKASHFTIWSIRTRFNKALEDARCNPNLLEKLGKCIDEVLLEAANFNNGKQSEVDMIGSGVATNRVEVLPGINIRDPLAPVKTKGRPKLTTRFKSGYEMSKETKKKRTCGYCSEKDHYITGCAKRKAEDISASQYKKLVDVVDIEQFTLQVFDIGWKCLVRSNHHVFWSNFY